MEMLAKTHSAIANPLVEDQSRPCGGLTGEDLVEIGLLVSLQLLHNLTSHRRGRARDFGSLNNEEVVSMSNEQLGDSKREIPIEFSGEPTEELCERTSGLFG